MGGSLIGSVALSNGVFRRALDHNLALQLEYETDSLLALYFTEAGLPPKKPAFTHWEGLNGHMAGHYLSALSVAWAVSKDSRYIIYWRTV